MLNRAACGVSGFKPTLKRSNLRTLCNVVVYHLAVVTETRNQAKRAKRPKRSTMTQSDKQRVIKTNKQKIDNDPIKQVKTSSALLGTSGKIDLTAFFMAGAKPDLCGLFIQKRLQNKWITGEICMGLFFFTTVMGVVCIFLSARRRIEFAKIGKTHSLLITNQLWRFGLD